MTESDLRKTVSLARTDFPMKANLPQAETRRLAQWQAEDLYGRIRAARRGRPSFVLQDGPPYGYANFAAPGLTVEQLIGTPLPDFAPPGREAEIRALLQGVLKTGAEAAYETTYEPPGGATIHFESRAARLGEDRIVVVARDVTGRKRAEESLARAMADLRRSNADLAAVRLRRFS